MRNKTDVRKISNWKERQLDLLHRASFGKLSYRHIIISDISDYIKIANLLLDEKYKKADRVISDLDTCERENIPNYIRDIIDKHLDS